MRAAILTGPRSVEIDEVPRPEPEPGQVLIRLEGSGLCGSNLPIWQGRPWFSYPTEAGAPGHEGWGRVAALGSRVEHLKEGDRVAAMTYNAFAEFDLADAQSCVALPPELSGHDVPGEPLACAMNVFKRSDIRPGQLVAVVGVGFLGALLVQLSANAGAEVIAVSRRAFALEVARRMGARQVLSLDAPDTVVEQVETLTAGQLCDRVIEATGLEEPLNLASRLTRTRGRLVIAGFHQDGPRSIDLGLWNWRGLDVVNAHERDAQVYVRGLREAVRAMAEGSLDPYELFTHRCNLERIHEAFEALEQRPDGFVKAEMVLE